MPIEVTGRVFAFSRWAGTSVCKVYIKDASGNDVEIDSDKIVCDALEAVLAKPVDVTVSGVNRQGKLAANKMIIHGNATMESKEPACEAAEGEPNGFFGEQSCAGYGFLGKSHFDLKGCFGVPTTPKEIHLHTSELCKTIALATAANDWVHYVGKRMLSQNGSESTNGDDVPIIELEYMYIKFTTRY